ncbi:MerR family transcriptional regulator [Paenibacillus mucilaginosus]|uniref:MerR family transcriptional regulator n=3 Tax=Paenibacillus mucilaginosus TaxID=61624 RepID=I0BGZ7_9BACL|nr:MerR family transcriptional regulator [Paenibacillus mucilaginosus]AEI40877.1 putative DNA binding protein [Paenibacillus mucilaginosus KNP414]AFC29467.1 putative DNA binding protein [Paenibacillus mucilaginosus 3016]AFH61644.1 MerR family transcriptional regulator [Paenibacillus mucilaginosus K02]MCG7211658.1 MerR family transcriptional regulator [Paenibacillus mucilaginosus]WDM29983.1 MerR family transcriptional regulator [Paenibacillus mucilaginosus]
MGLSIKEAAQQVGLMPHTLRFYEQEGLLPNVRRDDHGNRIFEPQDMGWLGLITCLRATGMPVSEIKRMVELTREGDGTIPQRKSMLALHRTAIQEKMNELQDALGKIDAKMEWYDSLERRALEQQ